MRTISTLFVIALAACNINIFNGGGGDDTRTSSHPDGGSHGSGDWEPDAGYYGADAGIYYGNDGGCGGPPADAGYYEADAGCPGGLIGSGGSGCIE